jgi:hypothetical protein
VRKGFHDPSSNDGHDEGLEGNGVRDGKGGGRRGVAAGQQVLRGGKVVKVLRLWIHNGDGEEARRQSQRLAEREPQKHWSEQLPDWSDWAA